VDVFYNGFMGGWVIIDAVLRRQFGFASSYSLGHFFQFGFGFGFFYSLGLVWAWVWVVAQNPNHVNSLGSYDSRKNNRGDPYIFDFLKCEYFSFEKVDFQEA